MSKMFTPNSPSSTSNYAKVFSPNSTSTHHKENNINGLFHLENQTIQTQLDAFVDNLSSDWEGSIPFHCHVINDTTELTSGLLSTPPPLIDICNFLGGKRYPAIRLHFNSKDYPPPKTEDTTDLALKTSGWPDLCRDLMTAAHHAGNSIICNGSQSSALGRGGSMIVSNKVFRCGVLYRKTRTSSMAVTVDKPYRQTLLLNDRKNNRSGGLSHPKRIKTVDCRGCTCKFQFMVKWDTSFGFFVELKKKAGFAIHSSHPKLLDTTYIPLSTRLLTSHQIEDALHVVNSTSNNGAARNYLHGRFGKFVNLIKVAYLCRKANGKLNSTKDDIDFMMENFVNSDEISFISLSDVSAKDFFDTNADPKSLTEDDNDTVTISTYKVSPGDVRYTEIKNHSSLEGLSKQISEERVERKLLKNDALFIAVAWISKPAFRLFKLCPEVVWVDATSHSNNKGFHLLTFSSRTSIGKQVVFMWVFIPNQQRFSFRWVFQEAIPTLLPKWLRDRVVFIMKDADPHQRNEILASFKTQFLKMLRRELADSM